MQPSTSSVRAPGRVNLIGEHTDYNHGFVLPVAVDLELRLTFHPRPDGRLLLSSRERPAEPCDLPASLSGRLPGWCAYVQGVRDLLALPLGIEGTVASDVPLGAGLSSSAALEMAVARALTAANQAPWDPVSAALLCQQAESDYAGSRCGIMDQLTVALGQAGHALLIDCQSLRVEPIPLPPDLALLVCDSARPRQLAASAYNERRAACDAAAALLGLPSLRAATPDMLNRLPPHLAPRALHVVEENGRVLRFAAALRAGQKQDLAELLYASHASLRDLFHVSCAELDLLVDLAAGLPGCIGSRLTGAGFGGCTISLFEASAAQEAGRELVARYRQRTGLPARAWVCRAVDGVSLLP